MATPIVERADRTLAAISFQYNVPFTLNTDQQLTPLEQTTARLSNLIKMLPFLAGEAFNSTRDAVLARVKHSNSNQEIRCESHAVTINSASVAHTSYKVQEFLSKVTFSKGTVNLSADAIKYFKEHVTGAFIIPADAAQVELDSSGNRILSSDPAITKIRQDFGLSDNKILDGTVFVQVTDVDFAKLYIQEQYGSASFKTQIDELQKQYGNWLPDQTLIAFVQADINRGILLGLEAAGAVKTVDIEGFKTVSAYNLGSTIADHNFTNNVNTLGLNTDGAVFFNVHSRSDRSKQDSGNESPLYHTLSQLHGAVPLQAMLDTSTSVYNTVAQNIDELLYPSMRGQNFNKPNNSQNTYLVKQDPDDPNLYSLFLIVSDKAKDPNNICCAESLQVVEIVCKYDAASQKLTPVENKQSDETIEALRNDKIHVLSDDLNCPAGGFMTKLGNEYVRLTGTSLPGMPLSELQKISGSYVVVSAKLNEGFSVRSNLNSDPLTVNSDNTVNVKLDLRTGEISPIASDNATQIIGPNGTSYGYSDMFQPQHQSSLVLDSTKEEFYCQKSLTNQAFSIYVS
jgi:hypothetical protein